MQTYHTEEPSKRRPVNLTIREDILKDARDLNLNASKAAEQGIAQAIKEAREYAWLNENKEAIEAHNNRIAKNGVLLQPSWAEE